MHQANRLPTNLDAKAVAQFSELAQRWWDKDGSAQLLHALNVPRLTFIQQRFSHLSNKQILDVGCGGGILTESLAKLGGDCTGIDASASLITAAMEHGHSIEPSITYHAMSLSEYAQHSAHTFDILTCMELIEHVPDPAQLIADCVQLLKPGGFLYISTINRSLRAYLAAIIGAEYIFSWLPKQTHHYHQFITPAELSALAMAQHLTPTRITGMYYNPVTRAAGLCHSVVVNYILECQSHRVTY